MTALDMVSLVEACDTIKKSLSELVPIELLVIDTIANPISLLMNKGQLQGPVPQSKANFRPRFDAIIYPFPPSYDDTIQSYNPPRQHSCENRPKHPVRILINQN